MTPALQCQEKSLVRSALIGPEAESIRTKDESPQPLKGAAMLPEIHWSALFAYSFVMMFIGVIIGWVFKPR